MKHNYIKKTILALAISFGVFTSNAQNVTYAFANAQITNDGVDDFYEADIMISSDVDFKLGSGQLYFNYDTAAFGVNVSAAGSVTFDHPTPAPLPAPYVLEDQHSAFPTGIYSSFIQNDNTTSRVSLSFQQTWGATAISANNVTSVPRALFKLKIKYVNSAIDPALCFESSPVFIGQFITSCGDGGNAFNPASCGTEPGLPMAGETFDCTNSTPAPLSVGDLGLNELSNVRLYPNPSSDSILLQNLKSTASVSIFSMSGKRVLSLQDYTGESINISGLTSGLYLVSIESETSKEVRKLVIK